MERIQGVGTMIEFPKCRLPTITFEQILRVIRSAANACASVGTLVLLASVFAIIVVAGRSFFEDPTIPLLNKAGIGGFIAIVGGKVTAWAADR